MIDKGADVLYAERFGVSDAAKERGKLAIGNVIDTQPQYPETVVASALWSMEPTIDEALKQVKAGTFKAADFGQYSLMKHNGSSLAPLGTFESKIPAELIARVQAKQKAILDGSFTVQVVDKEPNLTANDDISLTLRQGEVLALLGENGAGKSTLVSILFGHYVADAGSIDVLGKPLPPGRPDAALAAGVGMVHQHFTLADNLTVLDNIMVGTESLWKLASGRGAARRRLVELGQRFGLGVDPDARVGGLSVGEKQRVEILKALYRGARVLILDEPTAVLTPQEVQDLFATLRGFVDEGLAVIFISLKLDEVMAVSRRVAVLRQGKLVAERDTAGTSPAELAELMVGRKVVMPRAEAVAAAEQAAPVVTLSQVTVRDGRDGAPRLDSLDLVVHKHEIVAIAGVAGNGQQALVSVLTGLRQPSDGTIRLGAEHAAAPTTPAGWTCGPSATRSSCPARTTTCVVRPRSCWRSAKRCWRWAWGLTASTPRPSAVAARRPDRCILAA
ncbi:hypothetical protein G6F57_014510 [Rhizopus arrhizus]|nr:hypothetical protein G6F57_014510 [Rhizopus arrhizus]